MASHIQQYSSQLQDEVFDNVYYVDLYLKALGRANMSTASIDQHEFFNRALIAMWRDFRASLPDSEDIRRKPFQRIAELLERHPQLA
jgi:hypothetical protein